MPAPRPLFLLCVLFCLLSSIATAKTISGSNEPVLFKADEVSQDQELGTILARGHVEITQGKRILMADSVSYNQKTDTVSASGNVTLLEPTGEVIFAEYVELTDGMKNGLVKQLRVLLTDNSRFAAAEARRSDGNRTIMKKAVYSPCAICKKDPDRPLVWQIQAEKVEHDQQQHEIIYHNAFMEIFGVPVAYVPYFAHPDPTVKRKTGLLAPDFGIGGNVGGYVRVPYYIVLDKDKDTTIAPIYTGDEGLVFSGEYRQRFDKGKMSFSGSITEADRTDTVNGVNVVDKNEIRGHYHATADYHFNETWRAGVDSARATDRTYLRKFNFFGLNQDTLDTNVYLEGFRARTYAAANVYSFQDLRTGDRPDQPLIAPLAQYHHMSKADSIGGRMLIDSNFRYLYRGDGPRTERVSLRPGYEVSRTTDFGLVGTFKTSLQADLYNVDQIDNPTVSTDAKTSVTGRFLPRVTVETRYPFVRSTGTVRQIVEPIAMITATPNGGNPTNIPDEDSVVYEADDTNLFSEDRLPGDDRVESGQRVAYGLNLGAYGRSDGRTTAFIGQSYRFSTDDNLHDNNLIEENFSDIVGRIDIRPNRYANLLYRFAFQPDKAFQPRRSDVTFSLGPAAYQLRGSYTFVGATSQFDEREELNLAISSQITDHWYVMLATQQDLAANRSLQHVGLIRYQDECIIVDIQGKRSFFSDNDIQPSDSVLFRIRFKNLGEVSTSAG